jgi:hypothetical protein
MSITVSHQLLQVDIYADVQQYGMVQLKREAASSR